MERVHDLRDALLDGPSHFPDQTAHTSTGDLALLDRHDRILLYVVPIYVAGLTQGLMWRAMDEKGGIQYGFLETVQAILPMYWLRVGGGVLYILGALMFAYNFVMTWAARPAKYEEQVVTAPRLTNDYVHHSPEQDSKLVAVLDLAKRLDVWSKFGWHRRWEQLPCDLRSGLSSPWWWLRCSKSFQRS